MMIIAQIKLGVIGAGAGGITTGGSGSGGAGGGGGGGPMVVNTPVAHSLDVVALIALTCQK